MPKRRNKSKHRADEKKSKCDDDEKSNPIGEVFIKSKSTSGSDSSESASSSSDDSYYRKKRISKKKKRKDNKSFRKLQDQVDLFQRNVDIKLNYLECLLQTIIKNQEAGASILLPSPIKDNLPSPAIASNSKANTKSLKGSGILPFASPDFALSSTSNFKNSKKSILKNSTLSFEVPTFPLNDYDYVLEFDKALTANAEFRQSVAAAIDVYSSTFDSTHRDFYRAKSVMFYIFQMELLSQFSWAGLHFQSRGGTKKTAFRHFIGIIALVRASLNYRQTNDRKITDLDLVKGIKDALKRAPDKLRQIGFKSGPSFTTSDDFDSSQMNFKEEQMFNEDEMENEDMLEEI